MYMSQPPSFFDPRCPAYVYHLNKSLYGLKQAPRAWFHRLSKKLTNIGFNSCKSDSSLFFSITQSHTTFSLVYVDDILVTSSSQQHMQTIIHELDTTFTIKDLGNLHYILGIEAQLTSTGLLLTQTKYTRDLLLHTHLDNSKLVHTPITPTLPLSKTHGKPLTDPAEYRHTVGALQYLCLNLTFNLLSTRSQFLYCPTNIHWTNVKWILQYLRSTPSYGLQLTKSSSLISPACSNVD